MPVPDRPAAPRSPGGPPRASGVRAASRRPLVEIRTAAEAGDDADLLARWKQEAKRGGPGLLISAAVHAVLLLVMALIFIRPELPEIPLQFTLDWGLPRPESGTVATTLNTEPPPVRRPVTLTAVNTTPDTSAPPRSFVPPESAMPTEQGPEQAGIVQPVPVETLLDGRRDEQRLPLLKEAGGDETTERAIVNGLRWLQRQQQPAGNWQLHEGYPDPGYINLKTDTGATALALLALVGHGHTHQAGEMRDTVRKGLDWLLAVQKSNGDFHDHDDLGRQTAYYAHSQATIVVCELYALTRDERLREPAQRAVQFLLDSQQPLQGGWKYQPQNDRTVADLSVTGWALMALNTARVAGIEIPDDAFQLTSRFLDTVQDDGGAKYRYEPTPTKPLTAAMTAEGLLCRQFLGWPVDHPALLRGVDYLLRPQHEPRWQESRRNVYAWYYTGHVLHNLAGDQWDAWYRRAQQEIVSHQVTRGGSRRGSDTRGSWSPNDPIGDDSEHAVFGGRLYVTVLSLLILEMPYRHLPVYRNPDQAASS